MGAFVVADPKYAGTSLGQHHNKMRVVPASAPSPVVTTSDRVGSGALSVADPRPVCLMRPDRDSSVTQGHYGVADRSEEHTSELQSLMRISYAVFCLQKKKT